VTSSLLDGAIGAPEGALGAGFCVLVTRSDIGAFVRMTGASDAGFNLSEGLNVGAFDGGSFAVVGEVVVKVSPACVLPNIDTI
jgi:hypothetical protein